MTLKYKFIAFALLCSACITEHDAGDEVLLAEGDAMPWFSVVTLDGETLTPESLEGAESVIVFFNTDCQDCRHELPDIQLKADTEASAGVRYLCIAREEGRESVETYWRENGLTMPVAPQDDRAVYSLFARSGIPRTFRFSPHLKLLSSN